MARRFSFLLSIVSLVVLVTLPSYSTAAIETHHKQQQGQQSNMTTTPQQNVTQQNMTSNPQQQNVTGTSNPQQQQQQQQQGQNMTSGNRPSAASQLEVGLWVERSCRA